MQWHPQEGWWRISVGGFEEYEFQSTRLRIPRTGGSSLSDRDRTFTATRIQKPHYHRDD
jgi:hypothetical protein